MIVSIVPAKPRMGREWNSWMIDKPHTVMVVEPNDGDELVAHPGLRQFRQLLGPGWQQLGAGGTELAQSVTWVEAS
jgi:hypothetical protein